MAEADAQFDGLGKRLDKTSGIPLYVQLSQELESMIERGTLKSGDRLPGNVELGQVVGVNINTVSKAMARLVDKGLIVRRRRAGTFVTEQACPVHDSVGFYYLREREPITLEELEAMQSVLGEHRLDVKLIPFGPDFFKQTDLLEDIRRRSLSGAIFTVLPDDACREAMQALEKIGFPHVRVGNRFFEKELRSPLVAGDDEAYLQQTIDLLRDKGHERIGFLGSQPNSRVGNAYRKAMAECRHFRESWWLPLKFDMRMTPVLDHPISQVVIGYLHENPDLTAMMIWNPLVSQHVVEQAGKLDRDVPEHLSLVCLRDGVPLGIPTPCSAWQLSQRSKGEIAARQLLDLMQGKPNPPSVYLPWKYIDRASVTSPTQPAGIAH